MTRAVLPETFPIFPLPNVVLFPGAHLPLHLFEPRYREMTADALAGDRVIGMVLIKPGGDMMLRRAPVFEVGCLGVITQSRQLPDGRYDIVLRGTRRFRILDEKDGPQGYRRVSAAALAEHDFEHCDGPLRETLRITGEVLQRKMLELAQLTAPQSVAVVRERMRELDPVSLVYAVAFGLDCNPIEKQSLIECDDPLARMELLGSLIELRTAEIRLPDGSQTLN